MYHHTMLCARVLLFVAFLALVLGQQVGQRIGPATDDPRGMQGQQGFPPGAAIGDAYYGKLTVLGGARCVARTTARRR